MALISLDQALALTVAAAGPLGRETVELAAAAGRVLATPVTARHDYPGTDVSAMDGYAMAAADAAQGTTLRLVGTAAAGDGLDLVVKRGETARIFTGATVPAGCDWIVIQEMVEREGPSVRIVGEPGPSHIRPRASDFRLGDPVIDAGIRLSPGGLVAAAGAGAAEVEVYRRPRVITMATGDELVAVGAPLSPGGVTESLSTGLAAAIAAWGGRHVGHRLLPDDLPVLETAASAAIAGADLVVVTGGASVGERDHAKAMFEPAGLSLIFSKVAIKPGKPVWLGRCGTTLVLGLPGNPTSAMVTARLFLRPLIDALTGVARTGNGDWTTRRLAATLPATGDRETLVRAREGGDGLVPMASQDSGGQRALAKASWLIRCPAGDPGMAAGANVAALQMW